jgi:hypothetical protein
MTRETIYRNHSASGVPLSAISYEQYKTIVLARAKALGPCILPGGVGQPKIKIGRCYTMLSTLKGDFNIIRTGDIDLYSQWTKQLVSSYPNLFNKQFLIYKRRFVSQACDCRNSIDNGSVVYFIGSEDIEYVKIGTTSDISKRLGGIQTGMPFDLRVLFTFPGGRTEERMAHDAFAEFVKRGEWFIVRGKLKEYIRYMMNDSNIFVSPREWMLGT